MVADLVHCNQNVSCFEYWVLRFPKETSINKKEDERQYKKDLEIQIDNCRKL